jgi:nucleotide-binding universal stress UspA family protein
MFAPKRILVPTDFSAGSRAALDHAAGLAERFGATVVALHVWQPPALMRADDAISLAGEPYQTLAEAARLRASAAMDDFLAPLIEHEGLWFRRQLATGDPADAILDAASDGRFDLIVMGTHGRTGIKRMILGSVAEKVTRRASCPVLTIRDGRPSAEAGDRHALQPPASRL